MDHDKDYWKRCYLEIYGSFKEQKIKIQELEIECENLKAKIKKIEK